MKTSLFRRWVDKLFLSLCTEFIQLNFYLIFLSIFCFFFKGRKKREESLRHLTKHLKESYIPLDRKWMILFPEGGFLCKRREVSQNYAKKNNLPILENVSLPRVGAIQTIFDVVGPTQNNNSNQELNNTSSNFFSSCFKFFFLDKN